MTDFQLSILEGIPSHIPAKKNMIQQLIMHQSVKTFLIQKKKN